ncbi:alpha/beta hydrolase [Notoacmeibacter marinus]|uniref:alpha/beta hydrolase n=1 Tax=Notoacmeibacter marinus TaxID=1876515 RepID=UPI0019D4CC32|nr:alpha/beta fold hydrolase [Notoacmeibacter marinus]
MSRTRWAVLVGICLVAVASLAFWRVLDHDLDRRASEPFGFSVGRVELTGTLWLPDGTVQAGVVLVHGDGPQDRSSAGGYAPLVNNLLDAGIAVASWDKPGIGGSTGHWLDQSMADRAAEARAALALLDRKLDGISIGALGFSQAGWVLPKLNRSDVDFLVLVGPAVSWRMQGRYYNRMRLLRQGADNAEIEQALAREAIANERFFGSKSRFEPNKDVTGLGEDRWSFIRRNRDQDAREDLGRLDMPLLAIWGAEDLNVDASGDAAIYREVVGSGPPGTRIVLVANATHGLLKAEPYNWQLVEQWPWHAKLRFLVEGRYAFASGALDRIGEWILKQGSDEPVSPNDSALPGRSIEAE